MTGDSSTVALLLAAIGGLATAVGVLWRNGEKRHESLEKRTESHLEVATQQMKVLVLLEAEMGNTRRDLNRIGNERTTQIADLSAQVDALADKTATAYESTLTQHGAQMAVLQTLQAVLLQRNVDAVVPAVPPVVGEETHT